MKDDCPVGLVERIDELEARAAFQEAEIAGLRDALDEHGALIDRLTRELGRAQEKLDAFEPGQVREQKEEEPPPHY